ncbi:site-2 protease family protein [Priestia endophytica]|uniref:site-2 protease family protein n=1 Tax=Priestia endophytica TaxID=135735 RepID=UPI000DCA814F|nr:site-2 protease family protein [Priestia endophytica]RAS86791.1 hypothetical protein A4R27_00220 [Priestia endophytica]
MNTFKFPLPYFVLLIIFTFITYVTFDWGIFVVIGVLPLLAILLAVLCHELGHFLFCKANGYTFERFVIGPLVVSKQGEKFHVTENKSWVNWGQVVMTPGMSEYEKIRKRYIGYFLSGSMLNVLVFIGAFVAFFINGSFFSILLGLSNLVVAVISLTPATYHKEYSDGYSLTILFKNDNTSRLYMTMIKARHYLENGEKLTELHNEAFSEMKKELLEQMKTLDKDNSVQGDLVCLTMLYISSCYLLQERYREGAGLLKKAFSSPFESIYKRQLLANYLFMQNMIYEYEEVYEEEVLLDDRSERISSLKIKACFHQRSGQRKLAVQTLNKALQQVAFVKSPAMTAEIETKLLQSMKGKVTDFSTSHKEEYASVSEVHKM